MACAVGGLPSSGLAPTLDQSVSTAQILVHFGSDARIAVDMPIGLLDQAHAGGRECEKQARRALPGRTSSVFSSPCRRAVLEARSFQDACRINAESSPDEKRITQQAWGIFPKLRELDSLVTADLQDRVFEVHPELCFAALRQEVVPGQPRFQNLGQKNKPAGQGLRRELLESAGFRNLDEILSNRRHLQAQVDDILDACVSAWTARRVISGTAQRIPHKPQQDALGRRMEMWF